MAFTINPYLAVPDYIPMKGLVSDQTSSKSTQPTEPQDKFEPWEVAVAVGGAIIFGVGVVTLYRPVKELVKGLKDQSVNTKVADEMRERADSEWKSGHRMEAIKLYSEEVKFRRELGLKEVDVTLDKLTTSLEIIAFEYKETGSMDGADKAIETLLEAAEIQRSHGRYDEADRLYKQAIKTADEAGLKKRSQTMTFKLSSMWVKHAEELFKTKGKVATREIMLSYSAAIETLREAVIVKKMGVLVEVLKDIAITYSKVLEKLGKHEESGLNYEALADMVAERDPISAIRYYLTAAVTLEGVENTKRAGSVLAKRNSLLSQLASKDPHDLSGPTVSKTPAENRGRGGEIVVSTKMDDFMPEELKVDKPKISPELLSRISSLNEGDAIPPEVIRQLCLEIPSLDKSSLREALERGYGYKWSILVDMVGARTARHLRKIAQRDPSFMFKSDFSDDERKKTEKDGRLDGFEKGKGK